MTNQTLSNFALHMVIEDVLKPDTLEGKKVTLFDDNNYSPLFARNLAKVIEAAGAQVAVFSPLYYEAVWIKEDFTRDENMDKPRIESMNQSDYLFVKTDHVCNVVFFPLAHRYAFHNAIPGKGKLLFFLEYSNLTGICRNDPELEILKKLKADGRDLHIITESQYDDRIHRFL